MYKLFVKLETLLLNNQPYANNGNKINKPIIRLF